MQAPPETVEVAEAPHDSPKYSDQPPTAAPEAQVAPLEEVGNEKDDPLEVPRRKRSDLPRRPGTAWQTSSQLSGPLPTYSGYASPDGTAPLGQAPSLRPDDEEEIAAALFDLARPSRDAQSGRIGANVDDSLILPSSRKRQRKPSRIGIKYETNYDDAFDDEWDAEDEYLAKRRGTGRPVDSNGGGGYPLGKGYQNGRGGDPYNYNNNYNNNNGYQQAAPMNNGLLFKPGPNHVAISHFIQWHRQVKTAAPPQPRQQQGYRPPMSQGAALAAAAIARAQGMSQNHPGGAVRPPGGLDVSALAALLPSLQAGLRQGAGPGAAGGGNPLTGLLGQLVAAQQGRGGQLPPDAMNLLQQLLRRQSAQRQQQQQSAAAAAAPSQPPQLPPNIASNLAAVIARLKNAQAKAQGVAMAAAATQSRPPTFQNGQQQYQQQQQQQQQPAALPANQPPAAVLQNLKALLTANAQRAQQQGIAQAPPGTLPSSHVDFLQMMKQSLDMAKSNPNIGAWVAKQRLQQQQQQQQQQQAPTNHGSAGAAVPVTINATPADAPVPTSVATEPAPTPAVKIESSEADAWQQQQQQQQPGEGEDGGAHDVPEQGSGVPSDPVLENNKIDTNPFTAAIAPTTTTTDGDQIKNQNGALPSIPPFQPPPTGALDAMRAYLLHQKQTMAAPSEDGVDDPATADVNANHGSDQAAVEPVK